MPACGPLPKKRDLDPISLDEIYLIFLRPKKETTGENESFQIFFLFAKNKMVWNFFFRAPILNIKCSGVTAE